MRSAVGPHAPAPLTQSVGSREVFRRERAGGWIPTILEPPDGPAPGGTGFTTFPAAHRPVAASPAPDKMRPSVTATPPAA